MFPVLFSIGKVSISSFGVFLGLGFLFGIFLVWRLARAWDLDEEKILDLMLVTFIGGLFSARVYYAIEHPQLFIVSPLNLLMVNKIPGFSFWGGVLGGWLTLYFFTRRKRLDFWQLADIASVGLIGALVLSDIGCFLGGCNVGIPLKAFFAVTMLGSVGSRWPVQIIEAVLLVVSLSYIWSQAIRFHQRGKIVSLVFIFLGFIKLLLEPIKQNHSGSIFSAVFILLGLTIFYKITKQSPITHIKNLGEFLMMLVTQPRVRIETVQKLKKNWYNQKTNIAWKFRNLKKHLKRSNVKFS